MLIIHSASAAGARYWQKDASACFWLGRGAAELGLVGPVQEKDLRAVLAGRDPGGTPLTARPGLRTRQGWDLILAAPKSFSLLADAARQDGCRDAFGLARAYRQAVADTVSALEQRAGAVAFARQRHDVTGVVAAAFEHETSEAGQPHWHTHVVLANLGAFVTTPGPTPHGDQTRWGCLVGNELWRWREALGAGFHLALRSRTEEAGLKLTWEVAQGGFGELADVPRQAREAASARSAQVVADRDAFGSPSAASRRVSQGKTRALGPSAPAAQARFGPGQASTILSTARVKRVHVGPDGAGTASEAAVIEALAGRASTFTEPDVVVALGETAPASLGLVQALQWARQWCPGPGPFTSARANSVDEAVVGLAIEGRRAALAMVSPLVAERELAELATTPAVARAATHLACRGDAVSVLPPAPWLSQAACIDAARSVWQAVGMSVELATPSALSARRWEALTSLSPGRSSGTTKARPGQRVLIVDAADHMSPLALASLTSRAIDAQVKLVLVPGGTVPGGTGRAGDAPLSSAIKRLSTDLAHPSLAGLAGGGPGAAEPGPAWPGTLVELAGNPVRGAFSGNQSLAHLAGEWRLANERGTAPLMVAYGPAEAEALNLAARQGLRTGPEARLGQRCYAVGEQILALKRAAGVAAGTRGVVEAFAGDGLVVQWSRDEHTWTTTVGPSDSANIGYGYASTIPYLRAISGHEPLMVLGHPEHLGPRSGQCQAAWVTLRGTGLPTFGPGGREARRRAAVEELSGRWHRRSQEVELEPAARDLGLRPVPDGRLLRPG